MEPRPRHIVTFVVDDDDDDDDDDDVVVVVDDFVVVVDDGDDNYDYDEQRQHARTHAPTCCFSH